MDLQTYLSPVYAAERRSPSAFLFFSGEPVTARIRIFNQAETQATLVPRECWLSAGRVRGRDEWHFAPWVDAINVQLRAADADSRPIRPKAPTLTFEVRTPTEDDRPELLNRAADRQLRRGAYDDAKATVRELLRIHPRSVIAQMQRQQIAIAEGDRGELVAAIKEARTLLATEQDALLLKFHTPDQLREALNNLPVIREP